MATKTTLNAKNLEALGTRRLAELLIEISTGSAAHKRRLRLELAGSGVGVGVVVPAVVDTGFFAGRGRPYERRSPRPVPPERAAAAVLRAIEQDRAEVFVPAWTRVAPTVRALAPAAFRRLSLRYGEDVRSR